MKAKEIFNEHAAGWDVIENGVKLFTLEFITSDQPFYRFKVIDANCPPERVTEILNSAGRNPIEGLTYRNRLSQCLVADEMFCGGYHDEIAGIRDFRPIPGESYLLIILLGLFGVMIVFLLFLESRTN